MLNVSVKAILLALSLLILTSCASTRPEPIEVYNKPIPKATLVLPSVDEIATSDVQWYTITDENAEEVFAELERKGQIPLLFGVTGRGYESLSVNNAKVRQLVLQYKAVVEAYEKYYQEQTTLIEVAEEERARAAAEAEAKADQPRPWYKRLFRRD